MAETRHLTALPNIDAQSAFSFEEQGFSGIDAQELSPPVPKGIDVYVFPSPPVLCDLFVLVCLQDGWGRSGIHRRLHLWRSHVGRPWSFLSGMTAQQALEVARIALQVGYRPLGGCGGRPVLPAWSRLVPRIPRTTVHVLTERGGCGRAIADCARRDSRDACAFSLHRI